MTCRPLLQIASVLLRLKEHVIKIYLWANSLWSWMQKLRRKSKTSNISHFQTKFLFYITKTIEICVAFCFRITQMKSSFTIRNHHQGWGIDIYFTKWKYKIYNHTLGKGAAPLRSCLRANYTGMCCHTSSHWQSSGYLMPTEGTEAIYIRVWCQSHTSCSTLHQHDINHIFQ